MSAGLVVGGPNQRLQVRKSPATKAPLQAREPIDHGDADLPDVDGRRARIEQLLRRKVWSAASVVRRDQMKGEVALLVR
ncbi:MAG: hypothetical protein JOZ69_03635, partial [Myxococcales bacterium]|nr:hypothetical protein [Myxococcales bacterium]